MISTILEIAGSTALYSILTILTIVCFRIAYWCFSDLRHNKWEAIGLGVLFISFGIVLIVAFAASLPPYVFGR